MYVIITDTGIRGQSVGARVLDELNAHVASFFEAHGIEAATATRFEWHEPGPADCTCGTMKNARRDPANGAFTLECATCNAGLTRTA